MYDTGDKKLNRRKRNILLWIAPVLLLGICLCALNLRIVSDILMSLRRSHSIKEFVGDFQRLRTVERATDFTLLATPKWFLHPDLIRHRSKNVKVDKRGVIYGLSLAGNRKYEQNIKRYVQELVGSAKQLRLFISDDIGIALITDVEIGEIKRVLALWDTSVEELFDFVIFNNFTQAAVNYLDGKSIGWTAKVANMLYTPFESTLYVDADTRFCANPVDIFDVLRGVDMAAAKDSRDKTYSMNTNDINAGAIAFRKTDATVKALFDIIRVIFGTPAGDQGAFAQVISRGVLRFVFLPPRLHVLHCRQLSTGCIVSGQLVLFHGRVWTNIEPSVCKRLNTNTSTRMLRLSKGDLNVFPLEELVEKQRTGRLSSSLFVKSK
mmetsp:Transcript_38/g.62  ORF Transcript_38/g.62 Transcript_38/m.62 type:complete len:379 (-) Transcript_38:475-1611(-)|eukprot:CAMPEP_0182445340 /NCGR_PEP_ID=MMETSP1172-20130603/3498_1 /TAXON_ID=708627 /ORGANISM="Timspurckia oligopyrenoides, Strain CCMP3278" /LENGTH=378 /DNA_ID=CAMNT_0024641095 /DNA_START=113 /DNA_END=1249 /DNA_ORIENTATION=-